MARLKGNKLTIKYGATDYTAHLTSLRIEEQESDGGLVTFGDAAAGGSTESVMTGSAVQDFASASFWSVVWDSSGDELAFVMAPYGNTVPSATEPHFTGTVRIGLKPAIGGDAGEDEFEFDFEWKCVGPVNRVTSA